MRRSHIRSLVSSFLSLLMHAICPVAVLLSLWPLRTLRARGGGRAYVQVFEFAGSSVHDQLDRYPTGLGAAATKLLSWQLLQAAAYLHGNKVRASHAGAI